MPSWIIPALILLTLGALCCLGIYIWEWAATRTPGVNEPPVGGRHE